MIVKIVFKKLEYYGFYMSLSRPFRRMAEMTRYLGIIMPRAYYCRILM